MQKSFELSRKYNDLQTFLTPLVKDGVLVAYSGGVDSSFLLWAASQAAHNASGRVVALSTNSASMPATDRADANSFTKKLAVEHIWRQSEELSNPQYAQNDINRCYHCKNTLFNIAKEELQKLGLKWILYGYNASDVHDNRPGHKAAKEHGVLYPLAQINFSKEEIRLLLKQDGFSIADKPASPCLSSRIAHGIPVTTKRLKDIAQFEHILRANGIAVYRVRINKNGENQFLRIEVASEEMHKVLPINEKLVTMGKEKGYKWVTLDLAGYKMGGAS